ncbi:MAG: nicotinate phosphoribosyltransferase [Breznakia sp.]
MENYDLEYDFRDSRNLSMVMDFYELTMAQIYFNEEMKNEVVTFELFYRKNPDNGGYSIFAGLEEVIGYIQNLHFSEHDIAYLRSLNCFSEDFLEYLRHFIFTGNMYAMAEGTIVFPQEPLIQIEAKLIEAQIIETALLLAINHQTLIATKASRVTRAAKGRSVLEFGARRAHNFDAANYGARAAYIGGVQGSATISAGQAFGLPVTGTMAHSFIQTFDNEYAAFAAYAKTYPDRCSLLLDTFDTLRSGVKNAIRIAHEVLIPNGYRLQSVRLDSGDIAYLSKKVRKALDDAGLQDCKIIASNSFDEYIIKSLIDQGAKIDVFGVGENLICSKSTPVFGGVYKLTSLLREGVYIPKIKISDNAAKIINPGKKHVYRVYDKKSNKAIADLLSLHDEEIANDKDLSIYHPHSSWKYKVIPAHTFTLRKLLLPIFLEGKLVYDCPDIETIKKYATNEWDSMWDELYRFEYPQEYYVDLTKKLLDLKLSLLKKKV